MSVIHAGKTSGMSNREKRNLERSRRVATEGMVLLQNNGVLPVSVSSKAIALFGSGARRTVKGGTGSGDVNSRVVYNVEQGLEEAGFTIGSKKWLQIHDENCTKALYAYADNFAKIVKEQGWAGVMTAMTDPYRDPQEPAITDDDIRNLDNHFAIYVVARTSGEGSDRKKAAGDYELSEIEVTNITFLTEHFDNTIVIINAGGVIDTKPLRNLKGIGAVLLMSQAGAAGGLALADVLTGKVTPSGHLTTTWADSYSDYPNASTFSYMNGDVNDEFYNEGIYVGYRYFDSFGITPAYPFGYGLSYTDFEIKTRDVKLDGEKVVVTVAVKNTGNTYSGRETVQVYVSQPQGKLKKAYQVLAGFKKTSLLSCGQCEELEIRFSLRDIASYDEEKAQYILEAGKYFVRVGNHSRNTNIVCALEIDNTIVTEQLANKLAVDTELSLIEADESKFISYPGEAGQKAAAKVLAVDASLLPVRTVDYGSAPELMTTNKDYTITLKDVLDHKAGLEELVAQLTVEELADITVGSARGGMGQNSTIGAASSACPGAAGDTTSDLIESRGIMNISLADGPAGLRLSKNFVTDKDNNIIEGLGDSSMGNLPQLLGIPMPERPEDAIDYYQYCTALPIATHLAQTWDLEAIKEAGDIAGEEMEEFGVTLWLAPGMNIHRNPLCGRNFEYYSEDPFVAGMCAAADTSGVQSHKGCGTTIKHFALNNQEENRTHSNSHCSERAIREIYLKGFEIAIRESHPKALMTSYNLVNGVHAANNCELLADILRKEWGYEGLVMTDWGTTDPAQQEFKYGSSNAALCIKASNDLTMPGSQRDVDDIVHGVGKDFSMAQLQACALRVLKLVAETYQE